jgi:hypothetical protein|tara:strand:+ start:5346 stop:6365 length:1020 start_codon:yes stop_codon:yes gene_type:complete
MCEQQYFIEYVLGRRGSSNKKADKGTIVHKVLEILALMKKGIQDKEVSIDDEIIGAIDLNTCDMFDNKYVLYLCNAVYDYYTSRFTNHQWFQKDRTDCIEWVRKTLTGNNRLFDPRLRDVFRSEQHFDLSIDKPWAKYKYDTVEGELEGHLSIKGTVDLITKVSDDTLEIIDWKTGKRLNWATGEEKTQEKLEQDPQLRIYHYAIHRLFPEFKHIIMTINFMNDGGPFSICFDNDDNAVVAEYMIREKFNRIKNSKSPHLKKTWKCTKLCHFGKNNFLQDETVSPMIEYRDRQVTHKDELMTQCEQIKHDNDVNGMDYVVEKYTAPGHSVDTYKAPGEV